MEDEQFIRYLTDKAFKSLCEIVPSYVAKDLRYARKVYENETQRKEIRERIQYYQSFYLLGDKFSATPSAYFGYLEKI